MMKNTAETQINAYNEVLLDYGIYVLSETKPLKLDTSMLSSNDKAVPIVTNVVQKINAYYSTNDSTEGRVNFVVREDNGPNRRTQMVLVSASDCTFHWRFDGTRGQLKKCKFYEIKDADSHTYIEVWPCEGKFRYSKSSDEQLLELESHIEGFKLYLYICKDMSPTAKSFLQAIDGLGGKSHLKTPFVAQEESAAELGSGRDSRVCAIQTAGVETAFVAQEES
ncbi:unnamed protein product [Heligmosomoides polygyrus]|uniref:Tyrosine-protein phosphatase domain-containing protein n=1 Tax=Heligmosomoides polygyrus TaxID=6339 RepID=A0A3P7YBM8_HELPZ|nr:unnamed protein product [Heligmosomoides polygyrus]